MLLRHDRGERQGLLELRRRRLCGDGLGLAVIDAAAVGARDAAIAPPASAIATLSAVSFVLAVAAVGAR